MISIDNDVFKKKFTTKKLVTLSSSLIYYCPDIICAQVNYEQSLKDEEDAKLNSVVSKLSKKEFEHLFECGIELKLNQNKNQDVSVLPTVQLAGEKHQCLYLHY